MIAAEFFGRYEEFCPKELAMDDDPVGLQIGSLDKEIKKVLVTLDIREQTVEEAIAKDVDFIIAKHPVIFRPISNLTDTNSQENIILSLTNAGIGVYTSHTNIDIVEGGLNDWFCEDLGIENVEFLSETQDGLGIGRVGDVKETSFKDFAEKVKSVFNLDGLKVVSYDRDMKQSIKRVAICGGSGGSFYKDAIKKKADLYITGDIYYHTSHDMLSEGLLAIDPGHHIEVLFQKKVAKLLTELAPEVEVLESQANTNPFIVI